MEKKNVFLTGEWNDLLMANYEVDPQILQRFLPFGTELDSFEGKHFVSLVGFMFNDVRIKGFKVPFHVNFPEVNLRFYVRYRSGPEWKRGVVFIRELVPLPAISIVAELLYKEKYSWTSMRHEHLREGENHVVTHRWKWSGRWHSFGATSANVSIAIGKNSIEDFITNHYWGYSAVTSVKTNEYAVEHPQWEVYPVKEARIDCDFGKLYGNEFKFLQATAPHSVFHAVGSRILILDKTVIRQT